MTPAAPGAVRRTFASMSVRNYRLYFIGQTSRQTGTWMQRLAQAWLVLKLTKNGPRSGWSPGSSSCPCCCSDPWAA